MLKIESSRIIVSQAVAVSPLAKITDEGLALVAVDNGGKLAVKESTGAANEKFYGFSIFERRAFSTLPQVAVIPGRDAAFTQTLARFVDGSALIKLINADGSESALSGTPEATIDADGVVSVIAGVGTDQAIKVVYTRQVTIEELISYAGTTIEASELDAGADVGAIQKGVVVTSAFDTSEDWTVGAEPKLGVGGQLTLSGTGTTIPNAIVTATPVSGNAFLTIEIQ